MKDLKINKIVASDSNRAMIIDTTMGIAMMSYEYMEELIVGYFEKAAKEHGIEKDKESQEPTTKESVADFLKRVGENGKDEG